MLPEQIRVAVREQLTLPTAWVAFGVRTEALLTPGTLILEESAGSHRVKLEVDRDAAVVYTRAFPDASAYRVVTDVRAFRHLNAIAIGLEWSDGGASLRLADSPGGLRTAPVLQAQRLASS